MPAVLEDVSETAMTRVEKPTDYSHLKPYQFQPGNHQGGRPRGRLAAKHMIRQLVAEHPEYRSTIRQLLQASGHATEDVASALLHRVRSKDWRPQLRAVELIARITGELKESTIIQQQQVSVEESTKLRALAEALIAARPAPTVPVTDAETMQNQHVTLMNQQANSVADSTEKQTPTPPLQL